MNSFGWEVFWWVICRALRQVVTPISYWRSGCTFPYILFFRHFESWTPLTPEPSSFIAQCWKICRMRPQERKLIWEAVYDCLLFDLKIPQLLTADFSKILKHSVAFSGISPVYSLNLCTTLTLLNLPCQGRWGGPWKTLWRLVVGGSQGVWWPFHYSRSLPFHACPFPPSFPAEHLRRKGKRIQEGGTKAVNLPASVLPFTKAKALSKNTSSSWTGQDQILRIMNLGYFFPLKGKKNQLQRHLLMAWSRFILLLFKASSAGSLCQKYRSH